MPQPQRLPEIQLAPAARPVGSFLSWREGEPSRPGKPGMLPNPKLVNIIQRGNNMNVKGYNSAQEMADALKFLAPAVSAGLQVYKSVEYDKGRNEILKAASQINKSQVAQGKKYNKESRDLHRVNPVAGVMMDEVNPFRHAGRVNQASQLVAGQAPRAFRQAWSMYGYDLSKLDPSDPKIDQVRSAITQHLANQYGLDEFSAGFQEHAIPAINKEWEELQKKQFSGYVNYLKEVKADQTKRFVKQELMLWDQKDATLPLMSARIEKIMIDFAHETGLSGEAPKVIKNIWKGLAQDLQIIASDNNDNRQDNAQKLLDTMMMLPAGLGAGEGGLPLTVGDMLESDILIDRERIAEAKRGLSDEDQETLKDGFEERYSTKFEELMLQGIEPGSPQWQKVQQEAMEDPDFQDLMPTSKTNILKNYNEGASDLAELNVDRDAIEDYFDEWDVNKIGSDFDAGGARKAYKELMKKIPSAAIKTRKEVRTKFLDMLTRKGEQQRDNFNPELVNTSIADAIKEAVAIYQPDPETAAIQGMDNIVDILAYGKQQKLTGIRKLNKYLYDTIDADLGKAAAEKGGRLNLSEQREIIDNRVTKTLEDKTLMGRLMPKNYTPGEEPPAEGLKRVKVDAKKTYNLTEYPAVEDREQWQSKPLYSVNATKRLLVKALNRESLPTAFVNTANQIGITPVKLLLQHIDFYKYEAERNGQEWLPTPEQIQQLKDMGKVSKGLADGFLTSANTQGPMGYSSSVLVNILTGSAPVFPRTT